MGTYELCLGRPRKGQADQELPGRHGAPFAEALRAKYGLMVPLIGLGYKIRNLVTRRPASDDVAVELELPSASQPTP
jgi:hypothetical protein